MTVVRSLFTRVAFVGLAAALASPGVVVPVVAQGAGTGAGTPSTHLIVVSGLGGQPEYSDLFFSQAESLVEAALERWGVPVENITWLAEAPERAPGRISARSTKEAFEAEILSVAGRAGPQDGVLIVLIGHGSAKGDDSRINLPGPDMSGDDLAVALGAFSTQTIAIVNTASASGGFVSALSGERRIVVTATRSGREKEWTYFGSYFVDAFLDDGADTDKDERVSLLEAFQFASHEVERRYERDNQLLTEHALLDDNGDREGSAEPAATGADGSLAGRFFLASAGRSVVEQAAADPELAALLAEKTRLEAAIAELRRLKDSMDPAVYDAELERLVLDLAAKNRAIRNRGGGA
ncbi:MAG: C13 family peptidase [Gemmatimonadota bacterium]